MSLNKITKTALEALGEVCNQMVKDDVVSPQQVRDFLDCICYIMKDMEVQEGAGDAAKWLNIAEFFIRRWLKKQKGS